MATAKYSSIKLGPGAINDKNQESHIYCESFTPRNGKAGSVAWAIGNSYNLNDAVVYEGQSYNSLIGANLGNQPDISPTEWVPVDGKDGDVWVQVPAAAFPLGGGDSEIWLKVNTIWRPLSWSNPITVALNDGQVAPAVAFQYPAGFLPMAVVEYTVKRGVGLSRKRTGKIILLNDGVNVSFTHEFAEIGFDVQVLFDAVLFAGNVQLQYTSALEGTSIEMRYIVRGWQ